MVIELMLFQCINKALYILRKHDALSKQYRDICTMTVRVLTET